MPGQPTTTPKICTRCGVDCAARPRVKDPQGRYTCRECYDKLQAAAQQRTGPDAVSMTASENAIPIAEDADDVMSNLLAAEPRACANCGRLLGSAAICMGCGYNTQTGTMLGTQKPAGDGRACTKCGYDLSGLKSPRCPECGTLNFRDDRKARQKKEADRTVRNAYLKPAIMFVVGGAIAAAIAGSQEGLGGAVVYAVGLAAGLFVGFIVYWICSAMWIGFDQPMHLVALQLAGVYGATDAVSGVVGLAEITILTWLITAAVYFGLLVEMLEIDFQDAVIVGVLTFMVKVIIAIIVIAQLMSMA